MDKRVIFAVAGSGKTTYIINQLDLINNSLIITHTTSNIDNIRNSIIRKWGYFPSNIKLMSYFSFLHSFCFKPFLAISHKTRGLHYIPNANKFAKNDDRYISKGNRLYSNRVAKFLEEKMY
jgi:DNA helicase-2/ATP-dependent DNA helicase PcrA